MSNCIRGFACQGQACDPALESPQASPRMARFFIGQSDELHRLCVAPLRNFRRRFVSNEREISANMQRWHVLISRAIA